MKTTLNKIRKHDIVTDNWVKLLSNLGKTKADDKPLHIREILDGNELDYALWCLRSVDGYEREMRLYAVWCARQVEHLMRDKRCIEPLLTAEQYANGKATSRELEVAWALSNVFASDDAMASARNTARVFDWDAAARAAFHAEWGHKSTHDRAAERSLQESEFRRVLDCIDAGTDPYPTINT